MAGGVGEERTRVSARSGDGREKRQKVTLDGGGCSLGVRRWLAPALQLRGFVSF